MDKYQVIIAASVYQQLMDIDHYISNVLFARSAAKQRIDQMLNEIQELEQFPKRGFNADLKLNRTYVPGKQTYGVSILAGKYIVLYHIDVNQNIVEVVEIIPTKSDFIELFV